jgi:hypothetical protein
LKVRKKKTGIALATTLWIVVLIAILAFALLTLSSLATHFSEVAYHEALAFEAAQAGAAQALYNLANDVNWTTGFVNQPLPDSPATYSMTFNPGQPYYSVNNLSGSSAANGYFGAGTVPAGTAQIISTGTSKIAFGVPITKRVFISLKAGSNSFWGKFSLFGTNSVRMVGNASTDSFNSGQGTYAQTHSNTGGDIGTNGISSGVITLRGNVNVYGDLYAGPDSEEDTAVSSNGNVDYGTFYPLEQALQTPDVVVPPGSGPNLNYSGNNDHPLAPGIYGSLSLSGNGDLLLSSGTYVFTGNVNLTGNADIIITVTNNQPVIIYAASSWKSAGNTVVNNTYRPRNFQLYGGPNCTSMIICGNSNTYYAVYANQADVEVRGNGNLYGSVIGKTIYMNGNTNIHHDLDLNEVGPMIPGGRAKILSWYELQP